MSDTTETKYYGLYCPQHGIWLKDKDERIFYYSSKELMTAHWNQMQLEAKHFSAMRHHLWEVTEVGHERRVNVDDLPPLSSICVLAVNPFADLPTANPEPSWRPFKGRPLRRLLG